MHNFCNKIKKQKQKKLLNSPIIFQAARRQQRADATERSEQATRKMLTGLLKQHAVGSVLGNSGPSGSQPSTSGVGRKEEKADIYELPPMPAPEPEEYV